jgi:uncharacterized protein (TIGR03435 family)
MYLMYSVSCCLTGTLLIGLLSITPADGPPRSLSSDLPDAKELSDLFGALQSQLGLKLEAKKSMLEVLVVDHCERVPTEN